MVTIDGGIFTAQWSPDQSGLLIATHRQTLMLMSNAWQVMTEVSMIPCVPTSPTTISWRSDGQQFALMATDAKDGTRKVRLFDRSLVIQAVGMDVKADSPAKGSGGLLANLGRACAVSKSEALTAVSHITSTGLQQVNSSIL